MKVSLLICFQALLSLLVCSSVAMADRLEDGLVALDHHRDTEALNLLRPLAEKNIAEAQAAIGEIYSDGGDGIDQNFSQAAEWFSKAAAQGNPRGEAGLGALYLTGWGVKRDLAEAAKWYRKAAHHGNAEGELNLGRLYLSERQYGDAVKWILKSAAQGNNEAPILIGQMYNEGYGIKRNYTEAVKWFRQAADEDNLVAQQWLGTMYENGDGVDRDYVQAYMCYSLGGDVGGTWFGPNPKDDADRVEKK
jgi:TPR repeat protein